MTPPLKKKTKEKNITSLNAEVHVTLANMATCNNCMSRMDPVQRRIGLSRPLDIWMTSDEQCGACYVFRLLFVNMKSLGHSRLPLGDILSFHETPEWYMCPQTLHCSCKWMKPQF